MIFPQLLSIGNLWENFSDIQLAFLDEAFRVGPDRAMPIQPATLATASGWGWPSC